ncbi:uncharacterized protein (DUF1015 family) [Pedobacter sp. CAN_A7]|uniref:DUF1015 domain-containing protein n=1 Tax=Pedobacter sp. CAN_A7 TaxID=2787722 RepID=UPI0018CAC684
MPNIKPFNAFIPATQWPEKVVTRPLEDYSTGEAKLIASENECSFLHLINPELERPYLRGNHQELVFKKIANNLRHFLKKEFLVRQDVPAIYVYRVTHDDAVQTGIWTLTHIDDYLQAHIKKHELTVARRERLLTEYLQHTRIDANPVLITYPPDAAIDAVISHYVEEKPLLDFTFTDQSRHQVWAINSVAELTLIKEAFAQLPVVYLADGHHRIAAVAKLSDPVYFSTVYMNTQEIKILEFNRLLRDLGESSPAQFLEGLGKSFILEKQHSAFQPAQLHEIGMYMAKQWYKLVPIRGSYQANDPVGQLDVHILQENILGPLLGIHDPRTDARITFSTGRVPIAALQQQVDNGLYTLAFTLFPVAISQLMAVADADGVMPPKSTCVEPKFLVGLLTNYFTEENS